MSDSSSSPEDLPRLGRGRGRGRGRAVTLAYQPVMPGLPRSRGSSSPEMEVEPGEFDDAEPSVPSGESPTGTVRSSGSGDRNGSPRSTGSDDGNGAQDAGVPQDQTIEVTQRGSRLEAADIIFSREDMKINKKGSSGQAVALKANYYQVIKAPNWTLRQYAVIFMEDQFDDVGQRKFLVRSRAPEIGPHIFDGTTIYTTVNLPQPLTLTADTKGEKPRAVEFKITYVRDIDPFEDQIFFHFCNIVVRAAMRALKLTQIGRNYFDGENGYEELRHKLLIWPGFATSMRRFESGIMLCVEMTHKVLRQDTVLDQINQHIGKGDLRRKDAQQALRNLLCGTTVMTKYNKRTYKIHDLDFVTEINSKFLYKLRQRSIVVDQRQISFLEYYKETYGLEITNLHQPFLVSLPTKSDIRRGNDTKILLIPEFCHATGLTDEMRGNFNLMKDLGKWLHMIPTDRSRSLNQFMRRINQSDEVKKVMNPWELAFSSDMMPVPGRVLGKESIVLGEGQFELPDNKADWTNAFKTKAMLNAATLGNWVIIAPNRDVEAKSVDSFVGMMIRVGRTLGITIRKPEIIGIRDVSVPRYTAEVVKIIQKKKDTLDLLMTVLPNNKLELYSAIKKVCYNDYGVNSQCMVAKNLTHKGAMTIATKLVIQINAKLGGEPWGIKNPLKGAMVIGFDVHHGGAGRAGGSYGATVCSTNDQLSQFFSVIAKTETREELSRHMSLFVQKCLEGYKRVNDMLPKRIIFYRDGVGEGQLGVVYREELADIKACLTLIYGEGEEPKLTYVVITKRINTRLFMDDQNKVDNPPSGTIVDDCITLPERLDFFLIAQTVRQGTVGPTCYNVLSTGDLDADKIHKFSFKMTHTYFNWSGTISVPGVVQYAHKLAFLIGTSSLSTKIHLNMSHLLYFL